jgi:cytochrome b561
VAALVILQVLFHDAMADYWDAVEADGAPVPGFGVILHVVFGVTILVLALWRIALRRKHGAPPLPDSHPAVLKIVAHANHYLLYALLVAMPLTGASAFFLGIEDAADIHEAGRTLLLILVGFHVLGALVEHFVMKSNVLRRMLGLDR